MKPNNFFAVKDYYFEKVPFVAKSRLFSLKTDICTRHRFPTPRLFQPPPPPTGLFISKKFFNWSPPVAYSDHSPPTIRKSRVLKSKPDYLITHKELSWHTCVNVDDETFKWMWGSWTMMLSTSNFCVKTTLVFRYMFGNNFVLFIDSKLFAFPYKFFHNML